MELIIRRYKAEDLDELINLFKNTVHSVNAADYDEEQVKAWAPEEIDRDIWHRRLNRNFSIVAFAGGVIVGFAVLSPTANVEMLFVHRDHQMEQVGTELMSAIFKKAQKESMKQLTTQSSITAKSFFEKMGFQEVEEREQQLRGVELTAYSMKKEF